MLNAILGFLFGKQTNIFNKKGRVEHKFDSKKWEAWNNRLAENPKYDWRQHTGKTHQAPGENPKAKAP